MENEDAFAAEAQDEAVLSRRGHRGVALEHRSGLSSSPDADVLEDNQSEGEGSPLLAGKSATTRTASSDRSSSESYERAINQPWLGARGSEGLPWYKKPNVSNCFLRGSTAHTLIRTLADLMAFTCLLPFLPCLWWSHRPQNLPDTRPHLPRLPLRPSCQRSDLQILAHSLWSGKSAMPRRTCTITYR